MAPAARPAHRAPGVKMRQYPVEAPQEDPPTQKPDHRRYPWRASARLCELDSRRQEREVARREHNTSGETKHGAQDVTPDLFGKEDQPRPQGLHPQVNPVASSTCTTGGSPATASIT